MFGYVKYLYIVYFFFQMAIVARARHGVSFALSTIFLFLSFAGAAGLLLPRDPVFYIRAALLSVLFFNLLAFTAGSGTAARIHKALGTAAGKVLIVTSLSITIPFGLSEIVAWTLTEAKVWKYYQPMKTLVLPGTEDWRLAHITADELRTADPVLFWRPIPEAPYNSQGFRGPVVEIPKPSGTFRIMTYGDSNTDGPPQGGGWPSELNRLLEGVSTPSTTYEVVNAGVAGYSSHQGLLRFRRDVEKMKPDLVFVSFGWNDLPDALGRSDAEYSPPGRIRRFALNLLLEYRFFLSLKHYMRGKGGDHPPSAGPRVSLERYLENLEGFIDESAKHGAGVVLLTRPHKESIEEMRAKDSWRRRVPDYNSALLDLAEREGTMVVDVQGIFSERYPALFVDECHFTLDGHARMAEILYQYLQEKGVVAYNPSGSVPNDSVPKD